MSDWPRGSEQGGHGLRLRRGLMLLAACGLSLLWGARAARAALEEWALGVGAAMMDLAPGQPSARPRALTFNGARLFVQTQRLEQPLAEAAARMAARCRAHSGGLSERARALPAPARPEGGLDGVLRIEGEDSALVACLDLGRRSLPLEELVDRLGRFVRTHDLASLGGVRLARLEREGQGTFVVAVWSEGPLPLRQMFPAEGDAPGVDPPGLPRPEGSRRTLSIWRDGRLPSVHMYTLREDVTHATELYVEQLTARGFKVERAEQGSGPLFAWRGDAMWVLSLDRLPGGARLSVLPVDGRAVAVRADLRQPVAEDATEGRAGR